MKKTIAVIIIIPLLLLAAAFGLDGIAKTNTQKKHIQLMQTLLPNAKDFEKISYDGEDTSIRSVHMANEGYVIETATQGYADEIVVIVGVDNGGAVTGLVVYDARESLGLGSKILTDHVFLSQFLNKSGDFVIGSADDSGADIFSSATDSSASTSGDTVYVDGISGATVSSKAVARCVSSAVAYVTGADIGSSATTWGG